MPSTRISRRPLEAYRIFAEAVAYLAMARGAVVFLPFARTAGLLRRPDGAVLDGAEAAEPIRRVCWAIGAAARRVPWRAMCLEQGIAAHWMLRRRSVPAVLSYGIARLDGDLLAHAWVRAGSADVVGCENHADFAEVARFPAD